MRHVVMKSRNTAIAAGALALAHSVFAAQAGGQFNNGVTIRQLTADGGHLDWCHRSNVVAFDRLAPNGYFGVWLMNPDGGEQRPLTTRTPGLPRRHVGMPAWHPSCRFLAIQAQQARSPRRVDHVAVPGAGILNDLWLVTADGRRAWRLAQVSSRADKDAQGILHPHFSHDGKRLLWSQRIGGSDTTFGKWVLKLADFRLTASGEPRVGQVRTIVPGGAPTFSESHGFSPDDQEIMFSGTQDVGLEIYTLDLASGQVQRLTNSPTAWDEHAHFTPDGSMIAWMSSEGLRFSVQPFDLETEFWLMNADGSDKRRLTYFHQPGHPHHLESDFAVAADLAWGADGKSFVGLVITARPETNRRDVGSIFRVTLP